MHEINFSFLSPTAIRFGRGAVYSNRNIFMDFHRAYIVTGSHSGRKSGALQDVEPALTEQGIAYRTFEGIGNNPDVKQCLEQGLIAREFGADVVIGIGGGSPLDAAKAIAVFASSDISIDRLFKNDFETTLPVIAIPTTSGTGSEVTQWSVLTSHDSQDKCTFGCDKTFPKYALIDPKYTDDLPADITLNTAMDALTHCLESIISIASNPLTDAVNTYALRIFGKCMPMLETADFGGIRDSLMLVSTLGGLTIAQTGTTLLHAMGYPLTYFHGVPHGAANSLLLPAYIMAVSKHRSDRLALALDALGMSEKELSDFVRRNYTFNDKLTDQMIDTYACRASSRGSAAKTGIPCTPDDVKIMYQELAAQ